MNPELFAGQTSIIHVWDPRARIVSMSLLIVSITSLQSLYLALLGFALALGFLIISRIPLKLALRSLKWPVLFLAPFLLILPFTVQGDSELSFSFIAISHQGMALGALIFLKGLAAVALAQVMLGCCPFTASALALRDLGLPDTLVQIFLFSYRYIDLLSQELHSVFRSISARGFEMQSSRRTARVYGNAFGTLLLRSFARSERMFLAMLSRGYYGQLPPGAPVSMQLADGMKGLTVVAIAVALKLLEVKIWTMQ
ncbi:Energy-coupling factor transporter transmembrane protein EcfT [uncultured archaeon]|nr:Energy-coupling factor transporter transmembrane protein EcfT [uncultured archaeon]